MCPPPLSQTNATWKRFTPILSVLEFPFIFTLFSCYFMKNLSLFHDKNVYLHLTYSNTTYSKSEKGEEEQEHEY